MTAYVWFQNDDFGSGAIAQCLVNAGSHAAQALDTLPQIALFGMASNRTMTMTVAGTFSEGDGTISLSCRNQNSSGGNLSITTFDLNAIAVGTHTFQPWP